MKHMGALLLAVWVGTLAASTAGAQSSADLTGVWQSPSGRMYQVQQTNGTVTATFYLPASAACTHGGIVAAQDVPTAPRSERSFDGAFSANKLTGQLFACNQPSAQWKSWPLQLTLSADGNSLNGAFGTGGTDIAEAHFIRVRNPPPPGPTAVPVGADGKPTAIPAGDASSPAPTATPGVAPDQPTAIPAALQPDEALSVPDAVNGGSFVSTGGNLRLDIPAGAVIEGTTLRLQSLPSSSPPGFQLDGYQLTGTILMLSQIPPPALDTFEQPVVFSARPATKDLTSAGRAAKAAGIVRGVPGEPMDAVTLRMTWAIYDSESGYWSLLATASDFDGLLSASAPGSALLALVMPTVD